MATKSGTKTAASRSLDYTLRSDILDRVKEAGRTTGKDRDGGRGGRRGRRRVRDEAFERRRRGGSPRRISREERRRRVRVANTRK